MPALNTKDLFRLYQTDARVQAIAIALRKRKNCVRLQGLVGSSDALVAASVYTTLHQTQLFILPDREEAIYFQNDLENLLDKPVLVFPSSYKKTYDVTLPEPGNVLLRAETLNELKTESAYGKLIVTYPEAIAEKVLDKETLEKNTLAIAVGDKLSIDFINEFLNEYDFDRTDFVYQAGQFAIRGGIVDIFSFSNELPYRIEFFGDHIESIRTFEPEDQLSVAAVTEIAIVPNVQRKQFEQEQASLFSYLQPTDTIWIKEAGYAFDLMEKGIARAKAVLASISDKEKAENPLLEKAAHSFYTEKEFSADLKQFAFVEFGKQFHFKADETIQFGIKPQPSFNKDFNLLHQDLQKNDLADIANLIFTDSAKQVERLYAIFEDLQRSIGVTKKETLFTPINLAIREGFIDEAQKLACYTDHQIFDRYYRYKLKKGFAKSQALTLKELRDLKPGDFVTHIDHGIGKYAGLEKIEVNGKLQESIRLVYAEGDLMYVSINALSRISKFTGKEGTEPKLSKLGTEAWDKLKKSTKKKVKDIARDLIKLYAKRKAQDGNAFSPDSYLQTELEASFIYEDTPDQLKATADFKKDMEAPHPMDRLICGDVGFGKTEIAIRAAFKAVNDSKQVAILVPTTILALQHYKTFKERLKDFPCTVDYVNRFKSAKEIKETLKKLAEGRIDILIGTHRLISKDVQFKDLGLMIIDEEQKFGVGAKEKLKQMRVNVDTLTLTATPIPRTLHFSLMGARDLSIINTPPPNRQPVTTELHVFDQKLIKEAIDFEVARGGQVFFIHNRVKDIYEIAGLLKKLCPDISIGVGHGQLGGEELEEVMLKFVSGDFDVLVATTIIESGIDISNANTIIINHAHLFGLSDLHQMRGRVGRSNKKAFCYLLSPPLSTLTSESRKRLSAIEEFSDLGSGFNVAMRDLDIRGSGNMLGAEQSGFIAEIGFEMYHKILDEAIQELKEDEFKELFKDEVPRPYITSCQVETDQEILIPDAYVQSINERLNLYTELNKLTNETELVAFANQLVDRFGPIPIPVLDLFEAIRLQWLGKAIGFEKLVLKKQLLKGYFTSNPASLYFEGDGFKKVLQFVQANPKQCNMRENGNLLTLSFSGVADIHQAIGLLRAIA